jgi:ferredoxin-NADP reductase
MSRDYFHSRLERSQDLCGNVKHLIFRREDGQPMPYQAGQFVMIHFPNRDGIEINRSYSISAPPDEHPDGYALCVKKVEGGQGSTLLHALQPGDLIQTTGAHGRFTLRDESPRDLVLVATGTGVAPFRAMIPDLRRVLPDRRVWLLMGVRHTDELLYHSEWLALAQQFDNFRYLPTVSRPAPEDHWQGHTGYVSQFLQNLKAEVDPQDMVAYLCGVPEMVDDMRDAFQGMGLKIRAIRSEKFVSPPDPSQRVKSPT